MPFRFCLVFFLLFSTLYHSCLAIIKMIKKELFEFFFHNLWLPVCCGSSSSFYGLVCMCDWCISWSYSLVFSQSSWWRRDCRFHCIDSNLVCLCSFVSSSFYIICSCAIALSYPLGNCHACFILWMRHVLSVLRFLLFELLRRLLSNIGPMPT